MSYKNISFEFKGKKFKIRAKICGSFRRVKGLMFKSKENAEALLFEFKKPVKMKIHSFFVFFDFISVWFDENGKIIEARKIKPFTFCVASKKPFKKLLEIPINSKYENLIKLLRV